MKTLTFLTLTLVLAVVMALTPATAQQDARPLHEQVLEKYRETLQREDIQELLPGVLEGFKAPNVQQLLNPQTITLVVANPDLLAEFAPWIDPAFITLLKTDAEIQAMLNDLLVRALLQDPDEIDNLVFALNVAGPPVVEPPVEMSPIRIRDVNLYKAISSTLGLEANHDQVILSPSLRELTKLYASGYRIADLGGLEYATNLTVLDLDSVLVGDDDPSIVRNPVEDISALANLTKLEELYLFDTDVSDVSVLAKLTKLERLSLAGTDVSDVSALANLTQLKALWLGYTAVSDVSALANLTQLKALWLYGCPLSHASVHTHIPALVAKGVEVGFDDELAAAVDIPDAGLARAIREALGLEADAEITAADLRELTELDAAGYRIADLGGLEYATNLIALDLGSWYSDDASGDSLSNPIEDISALANLTQLETLDLASTNVWDVSALAKLTQLTRLVLFGTDVSDISALANLTQLEYLDLADTDVSDISLLVGELQQLEYLRLYASPLSHASVHTHIPALRAKGVEVMWFDNFDNVAHRALLKVSGDNQEGAPNTALPDPLVVEATDENGQPIVGLSVLFKFGGGRATVETDANGRAAITLTLSGPGVYKVKASEPSIDSWVLFTATVPGDDTDGGTDVNADVTEDGEIDVDDLVLVARHYGKRVAPVVDPASEVGPFPDPNFVFYADPRADVNGDDVVDVADILAVIAAIDDAAAAPSLVRGEIESGSLRAADVRQWLRDAKQANADPAGIAALEQLLAALTRIEAPPKETVLLANYPNPFNPETWIPYQLSESAEVQFSIYSVDGQLVRKLELGQVPAGVYQRRSRAAYWDGRNAVGEPVASGVYFYTLTAGEFSATRKMVIRK